MRVFATFQDFLQCHRVQKHSVMQIGRVWANLKYIKSVK